MSIQENHSPKTVPDTTLSRSAGWELAVGPPPEKWDSWSELDATKWPERVHKHYRCIPTICFNCESGCGLLAFVDKADGQITKFEGNPVHPGSRGRTCAKGPATINQLQDPQRITGPLKRVGPRGAGQFEPVSWDEALDDIAGRITAAIDQDRHDEVMYHVGRPGEDHYALRTLLAWGLDAHNSHTNVCSGAARLGFAAWCGADRPSPDYSNAKFILLLSAHLETGHYFNPHAQRIVDAMNGGARCAVVDPRLSNSASRAHIWLPTWPGSEAALLLAIARELLLRDARGEKALDRDYLRRWCNWEASLGELERQHPDAGIDEADHFERFLLLLSHHYAEFTPELVATECRMDGGAVKQIADEIVAAEGKFASHLWRNAAAGNLGGWQIARSLVLLHVLTGSLGREGGVNPNSWDKFAPKPSDMPPHHSRWNELLWPKEWPLAHYEMSFLLPHLVREQKKKIDVYFTRVYNPVWTNPDGCAWIEMLEDEAQIGCHIALTPTWNETAQWADYVLPMGHGPERHDIMSQETHAGTWIGFRQPVLRRFAQLEGTISEGDDTRDSNPGDVWEEAEFWAELTWRMDPDGSRGMRKYFESKDRPGERRSQDEYWKDVFDHAVPGLPEAAAEAGLDTLEFMRQRGAFDVPYAGQERFEKPVEEGGVDTGDGVLRAGFPTPSKKLELFSPTLDAWSAKGDSLPAYQKSHVHWENLDEAAGDRVLLPTFRLPTLIHTRSANAKWLQEISHTNPLWVHPEDAEKLRLENGKLARVSTAIGHFVVRAWVTEGIHPGIVACSHHVGRWRLHQPLGAIQASSNVDLVREGTTFMLRQKGGAGPYSSFDPDTERIWWKEVGVNQNLTFPVQPDPASGMHCWHQKVNVTPAGADDQYGDIFVDTQKSIEVYEAWKQKTKPAPGPDGTRRPLWMNRPLKPTPDAYEM
ncbi:MAG: molybdopterin-dependent oxidoreductase [Planctomycetota bacterium]|nr:molybdopterin-dependent oxidoreductase [Planctomycetota bacterium]